MKDWMQAWLELEKAVDGRQIELHSQPQAPSQFKASVYVRGDDRDTYRTCVASGGGKSIAEALIGAVNDMKEYQSKYKLSMGKLLAMQHSKRRV